MKLISDVIFSPIQLLEATDQPENVFIEGVFAQAEMKNRNGRIYPKKILETAIKQYIEEYVVCSRALGELNHPESPIVNPERACILIKELHWQDNNVVGRAKVLNNTLGKDVQALIKDGVQLGVSTRGLGSIRKTADNSSLVEDDFTIKAIDVVHNPSGIDCFVDGILENVEFYYENGHLKAKEIEKIQENVRKNDIVAITKDFSSFVSRILHTKNV
jgi:hypothetical protein